MASLTGGLKQLKSLNCHIEKKVCSTDSKRVFRRKTKPTVALRMGFGGLLVTTAQNISTFFHRWG
jgi:hypothetical protein